MKRAIVLTIALCCFGVGQAIAVIKYDSGGEWNIDSGISFAVYIENNTIEGPTTVNLLEGGFISRVLVYNNSVFNMFGGEMGSYGLVTYDSSFAYIYGGIIGGALDIYENSTLTISGCFNYPSGAYTDMTGCLIGKLDGGEFIDTIFYIHDEATMILTPEPPTILLLGFGAAIILTCK